MSDPKLIRVEIHEHAQRCQGCREGYPCAWTLAALKVAREGEA
jgi:hypothetical protein